jgi:hypothetical protein
MGEGLSATELGTLHLQSTGWSPELKFRTTDGHGVVNSADCQRENVKLQLAAVTEDLGEWLSAAQQWY